MGTDLNQLDFEMLKNAVSGHAVAIRCRTVLQPAAASGTKVFPPTHSGGVYATETRRVPVTDGAGKVTGTRESSCVLLDSVQSQANRIEDAMRFKVVFEASDDCGYMVYVPALPGCISEGDTVEEARVNILEAIAIYLPSRRGQAQFAHEATQIEPVPELGDERRRAAGGARGFVRGRDFYLTRRMSLENWPCRKGAAERAAVRGGLGSNGLEGKASGPRFPGRNRQFPITVRVFKWAAQDSNL